MTIQLSDEAQVFVKSQLATGHFADESEGVSRLLEYVQEEKKRWEAETYAKVQESMKSVAEGRSTRISSPAEAETFAQQLLSRAKENRAQRTDLAP